MRHVRGIWFSDIERVDLLKAWLATSLAFGVFFIVTGQLPATGVSGFAVVVGLAAVTAGVGFVGHELAHKFTANHFGVHAEFRSNDTMLGVMILFSFLGFIFAAPGAVMIMGQITRRENGIISAAGPITNLVLAACFLPLSLATQPIVQHIGTTGLLINALLGVFNMIPLGNFDGNKVLAWSKAAFITIVIAGGLLLVAAFAFVG